MQICLFGIAGLGLSTYAAGAAFFGAVFTVFAVFAGSAIAGAGAGGSGVGVFKNGEGKEEGGEGD